MTIATTDKQSLKERGSPTKGNCGKSSSGSVNISSAARWRCADRRGADHRRVRKHLPRPPFSQLAETGRDQTDTGVLSDPHRQRSDQPGPNGLRIAVADDEPMVRRYFQEILPDLGHEVAAVAANGRELVEQCRQSKPDLVITDIKMPVLSGIEAAIEISKERPIPIILVSAYHDPDLIGRAEMSRIMAYLIKPIERADLETAIAIARSRFRHIEALEQEVSRLEHNLQDRKDIDRAKAVLLKTTEIQGDENALRELEKRAQTAGRKLVEVARSILQEQ